MTTTTRNVQPIHPTNDARVKHAYADVNGHKLHYVIGEPKSGNPRATVVCIHGFPDMWYGWRYTIPVLLDLNLRVIAPDCLGYGGSSAPKEPLSTYSLKSNANAISTLLTQLNIPKVTLLAHDWGSMIAWRFYNFHPEQVTHIISFCVPYAPPNPQMPYQPLEDVVKKLPNFKYQVSLADPQTEVDMEGRYNIKRFLKALYRGVGDGNGNKINVEKDIMKSAGDMERGWVISEEDLEWYTEQFDKVGMHGPLSYYKTRKINYSDEKELHDPNIKVPVLFIGATRDAALPLFMAEGQSKYIPNLTTRHILASHWVSWEKTDEVNNILKEWFDGVVFGVKAKL